MDKAIVSIVAGCVCLVVAIVSPRFYWVKGRMGTGREAPRWVGQWLFGLIGASFILVGLRYFLLGY